MPSSITYKDFYNKVDETVFWGNEGAGALFIAKDTGRILLFLRSDQVNESHTWNLVGGRIDDGEDPKQAAAREIEEESGYNGTYNMALLYTFRHKDFKYHNYLALIPFEFTPSLNWEHTTSKWVEFGDWPSPLHFGLNDLIKHAGNKIKKVVDIIKKKLHKNQNITTESTILHKQRGYLGTVYMGVVNALYDDFNPMERDHSELPPGASNGKWRYFIDDGTLFWDELPEEENRISVINWLNRRGLEVRRILNSYKEFSNYRQRNKMMETMDTPPPPPPEITAPTHNLSSELIDYIKSAENVGRVGFNKKTQLWFPHKSSEGGLITIAYGHKLKPDEVIKFSKGINDQEVEELLKKDLEIAKDLVMKYHEKWVIKYISAIQKTLKPETPNYNFYMNLKSTDPVFKITTKQLEMLVDYAFNLGSLNKFPNFVDAVMRKDWTTSELEYKRKYKDAKGTSHELTRRNQLFHDKYLQ